VGLYNFKAQFVAAILAGTKRHTIRGERKHQDKPGSLARLQTGPRFTPTLLFYAPVLKVQRIEISKGPSWGICEMSSTIRGLNCPLCGTSIPKGLLHRCSNVSGLTVMIDGQRLGEDEKEALFVADGFPGGAVEAAQFWDKQLSQGPFTGYMTHWDFEKRYTPLLAPKPKRGLFDWQKHQEESHEPIDVRPL
jgi:hypothetical protein